MAKGRIRASIPKSMVRVVPDEDLSNLKSDITVRQWVGPDSMDSPGIVMELRKHRRDGATDDDIQLATPGSSTAHLELGTRDPYTRMMLTLFLYAPGNSQIRRRHPQQS